MLVVVNVKEPGLLSPTTINSTYKITHNGMPWLEVDYRLSILFIVSRGVLLCYVLAD
jgi:hypothetical protein